MKSKNLKRWRASVPDKPGWWLWRENWPNGRDERLLIVCGSHHSEVAGDDDLAQALGSGRHRDRDDNYWEGTDTATMGGYWKKD